MKPTQVSLDCNGKDKEIHTLLGYQIFPSDLSKCHIATSHWEIPAAPRPIHEAALVARAIPAPVQIEEINVEVKDTDVKINGTGEGNSTIEWKDMDDDILEQRQAGMFEVKIYSISALVVSLLSLIMTSGISVIFKRNFGFLFAPLAIPIQGVADAIAGMVQNQPPPEINQGQEMVEMAANPPEENNVEGNDQVVPHSG